MKTTAAEVSPSPLETQLSAPPKLGTVAQTLAVLRFLATSPRPTGVNAIARELRMAPSSCFKILKQLRDEEFAQFDPLTKCYSLGGGAVVLARRALDPEFAFSLVRPKVEHFAMTFDVSVGFWRRIDERRIVLAGFVETQSFMRIHMSVGQRLPMLIGAVGRAFAAEMGHSRSELEREFTKLRWQVPPNLDHYVEEVESCRVSGYAIDQNNFAAGVTTIATALPDAQGTISFGLSAIRFSGPTDENEIERIGRGLVVLKQELTRSWLNSGQ